MLKLFNILGFGILPEGRMGSAGFNAFMFLVMFVSGFVGFYLTARRRKEAAGALKCLILAFGALLGLAQSGRAYDNSTHKTILSERAAFLIHQKSGQNYQELLDWKLNLMTGTDREDPDRFYNVLEHFYRPTDGVGLWNDTRLPKPLDTSALSRLLGQSRLRQSDPTPYFANAVEQYKAGDKGDAYLLLGRALHLATQDMFSPPHTHNDAHLILSDKCYTGSFGLGIDPICPLDFVQNGFEGWARENFARNTADARTEGVQPATYVGNLVPTPADVGALLDGNAQTTYKAVRIQGTVNESASNPASGALGAMFPAFDSVTNPHGMIYEVESNKWSFLFDAIEIPMHKWTIKGVGSMHETEGKQGYSVTDAWWKAENFSANDSGQYFYLENPKTAFPRQYNDVATNGESLAELWALGPRGRAPETAKGLLAQSQESSAGLMKRFAEFVDPLPPEIKIQDGDLNVIAANSSTNEPRPYITLNDPVTVAQPMPSGHGAERRLRAQA